MSGKTVTPEDEMSNPSLPDQDAQLPGVEILSVGTCVTGSNLDETHSQIGLEDSGALLGLHGSLIIDAILPFPRRKIDTIDIIGCR